MLGIEFPGSKKDDYYSLADQILSFGLHIITLKVGGRRGIRKRRERKVMLNGKWL